MTRCEKTGRDRGHNRTKQDRTGQDMTGHIMGIGLLGTIFI